MQNAHLLNLFVSISYLGQQLSNVEDYEALECNAY